VFREWWNPLVPSCLGLLPKDGSTGAAGRFYFKVSAVNGVGTGEGVRKSQDVPGMAGA
jgi:hypothetical protein